MFNKADKDRNKKGLVIRDKENREDEPDFKCKHDAFINIKESKSRRKIGHKEKNLIKDDNQWDLDFAPCSVVQNELNVNLPKKKIRKKANNYHENNTIRNYFRKLPKPKILSAKNDVRNIPRKPFSNITNKITDSYAPNVEKSSSDGFLSFTKLKEKQPQNPASSSRDILLDNQDSIVDSPLSLSIRDISVQVGERKTRSDVNSAVDNFISYEYDVYSYLRKLENHGESVSKLRIRKDSIVNNEIRSVLVDWMIEVADEFKMSREATYLAVNILDKCLNKINLTKDRLQLIATSSLMIASKFEDIYPPGISKFAFITQNTYDSREIASMEALILHTLDYRITPSSLNWFITWFLYKLQAESKQAHLALYLVEISMLHGDVYLKYNNSLLSAAAVALARYVVFNEQKSELFSIWPDYMVGYTQLKFKEFNDAIWDIYLLWCKISLSDDCCVSKKYKKNSFYCVSRIKIPDCIPDKHFINLNDEKTNDDIGGSQKIDFQYSNDVFSTPKRKKLCDDYVFSSNDDSNNHFTVLKDKD